MDNANDQCNIYYRILHHHEFIHSQTVITVRRGSSAKQMSCSIAQETAALQTVTQQRNANGGLTHWGLGRARGLARARVESAVASVCTGRHTNYYDRAPEYQPWHRDADGNWAPSVKSR
eukprot:6203301-Pleurochrysis_carterae.AAC.3